MTRRQYVQKLIREVYGDVPSDSSSITEQIVNLWLIEGVGVAAHKCYSDSLQIDGVAYLNNGFYTTYKGLGITKDENFLYKITLPEIPPGIGKNEGIAQVLFKNSLSNVSYTGIPLSQNQLGYQSGMRPIPNKILYYPEGIFCYVLSTLVLTSYTAQVKMVSGGDSTDLDSVLNLPSDYFPIVNEHILKNLMAERNAVPDLTNDGVDNKN